MARAHGYLRVADPDAPRLIEYDTIQCGHCGAHTKIKPGTAATVYLLPTELPYVYLEVGGCHCGKCDRPICVTCHERGRCTPFELWLDQQEQRIRNRLGWGRFFRYVGLGG
jgi:hypothetical protein